MGTQPTKPSADSSLERRFGDIAVSKGYITPEQLKQALADQQELKKLGMTENLGAILCKRNFMEEAAVNDVLSEQIANVRKLGDFEIMEKVGRGGMGMVFKARQVSMDRIVALKILSPRYANDKVFVERFVREARSAGQFNHENIVTAVDVGYIPPYRYLVMDFVDGENMRRVLGQRGRLPERESLKLTMEIARALEHALRKGVIHRDVKPDNVMLSSANVAKLLDMGLACAATTELQSEPGKTGENSRAAGTPHYIAPEAARGEENIDTRADIYSLGCTLYQFLTGTTPYEGTSGRVVMAKHLTEPFPDVRTQLPNVSVGTARILATMTSKERDERYQNPTQVIEDIRAVMEGGDPVHANPLPARRTAGYARRPTSVARPAARRTPGGRVSGGNRTPGGARRTTSAHRRAGRIKTGGTAVPSTARIKTGGTAVPSTARVKTGGGAAPSTARVKTGGGAAPSTSRQGPGEDAHSAIPPPRANPMTGWIIAAMGIALLLTVMVALLWPSRNQQPVPDEETPDTNETPAVKKKDDQPADKKPNTGPQPKKKTAVKEPAKKTEDPRLGAAKRALDSAKALQKQKPNAHATIIAALGSAHKVAQNTKLAKTCENALAAARKKWEVAFGKALKGLESKANVAIQSGDFTAAMKAMDGNQISADLRASDWQARLKAAQQPVRDAAEKKAAGILAEARKKAAAGDAESIKAAIKLAQSAQAVPYASSAAAAGTARKEWEKKLGELQSAAEKAEADRKKKAKERFMSVWKEITPLLKKNRFSKAMDAFDEKIIDKSYADSKTLLQQGKSDIEAILALRKQAVAAINKKAGEEITLKKGPLNLTGKIKKSTSDRGVDLKLDKGPEMTIGAHELDVADVDKYAPQPAGAKRAQALLHRGLLFLAAGDGEKAKTFFVKARAAGLGDIAQSYLDRVDAAPK